MRDDLRRLISEAVVLMQGVDEGTLRGEEKERKVVRLLMEVLKIVAGPGGGDADAKKATKKQATEKKPTSGQWTTVPLKKPVRLPEERTNDQQPDEGVQQYQYPEWHVHHAWAGKAATLTFHDAISPAYEDTDTGLVLVRAKNDWETLRQSKTNGSWGAISARSLNKYSRKVALPVMKKCGTCEVRPLFYTHVCGVDFSTRETETSAPCPDPVLFVQDWKKSSETELRKKVADILVKADSKGSIFGYKKAESHTSMAVRVPAEKVDKILLHNNREPNMNESKSTFVRNPKWSNGNDVWPVMAFHTELGFVAAKAKTSVLASNKDLDGNYYFCRFKSGYGLRVHPSHVKEVRSKLDTVLRPALPTGDRYIIKSSAIRKFTSTQISEFLEKQHAWKHTVVATFHKGATTTLIAIAESQPPNFVCIGSNTYLVINREVKRSEKQPLGPVYNTGAPQQVVTAPDHTKRRRTEAEQEHQTLQVIQTQQETSSAGGDMDLSEDTRNQTHYSN
eukprot:TRINITY_DN4749_c0_g2_i1.p1 TRINITY_DN4749_c0_g2~~TRINITY_DN4749_c0_g2_i1.p1  ORF type:complete len:516 (+),score=54.97 TRINITY_DN4749_c0_g2_i1:32-1549(+)